ncbi:N-terminal domain of molybdenum-binding protein [Gottschalkia purinilytica]|uniref:N-terminal domain of molybdenum-binding protein n=1 Tax=Gottschalkia purinilytica TaxID=1503 RepID=A0A0L0WA06_GOTPU|nr:LysR family transcriptional regulator [Gottschalkia purinilytica]KNF08301.1 N-terminal domain of molybdenum-binding protein [Gottschalkia purinilytica]
MLELRFKIWLEKDGKAFGLGPYELLRRVREMGSLSEAAKSMKMSYNKAHNLMKSIEKQLGIKLLVTRAGGSKGGGSELTEEAENLMEAYKEFLDECTEALNNIFQKHSQNMKF